MGGRRPQQARAGLIFPSRENVVFELRPGGQPEFVLEERDLVLHKRAVNIVGLVLGQKINRSNSLDNVTRTPSCPHPPYNFVSPVQNKVMDEIKIKGIASFAQLGSQTIGPVIITLDLQVRSKSELTAPAP